MQINLIAAVAENCGIGYKGQMPWGHAMKADLARFRRLTLGHTVIMGRKTFESLGRVPLPDRHNVVLTHDAMPLAQHALKAHSIANGALSLASGPGLERVIERARAAGETECFIIGGASVFEQAYPLADRLYLTVIHAYPLADTLMPPLPAKRQWRTGLPSFHEKDADNPHDYTFLTLTRQH